MGEPTLVKDVESEGCRLREESGESFPVIKQSGNETILHVKQPPKCIAVGFSGVICEADKYTIVKHPKVIPNNSSYNQMFRYMIMNERLIYERLGKHEGIIPYLGVHNQSTGAIKLAYAKQGDLECYIQSHDEPPEKIRATWIQSLVETFWYIYSQKILHQDVKPNNILVEKGSLKIPCHELIYLVLDASSILSQHGGSSTMTILNTIAGQNQEPSQQRAIYFLRISSTDAGETAMVL